MNRFTKTRNGSPTNPTNTQIISHFAPIAIERYECGTTKHHAPTWMNTIHWVATVVVELGSLSFSTRLTTFHQRISAQLIRIWLYSKKWIKFWSSIDKSMIPSKLVVFFHRNRLLNIINSYFFFFIHWTKSPPSSLSMNSGKPVHYQPNSTRRRHH